MQKILRHNAAYKIPLESLDVVVVEDSKQMQTIIRSMLGAMRVMRVRTFDSAEGALQAMLHEPPHVIITDWRMDPISGYQLLRSIRHRRMAPLCFVPVLMVTAHGTRSLVEKALRAGAHHVLVKPLAPSALHQRLEWITRDERKYCLEEEGDFFVIEGVSQALAMQSERRRALDRARLHHARRNPTQQQKVAPPEKVVSKDGETFTPAPAPKEVRPLGELARPTAPQAATPSVKPASAPAKAQPTPQSGPAKARTPAPVVAAKPSVAKQPAASSPVTKTKPPMAKKVAAAPSPKPKAPEEPVREARPRVRNDNDFAVIRTARPGRRTSGG